MQVADQPKALVDLNADDVQLADLSRFPEMTGWFSPVLLLKLLKRVIVSELFGQYADRRLIEAALDPVDVKCHVARATSVAVEPSDKGDFWVDYVSDLGDGFDSTYAVAYALAQENITVGDHSLPRAGMLIMGGDEVYPTAEREDYKVKMRLPYEFAWPMPKEGKHTPLFALPGNHDWYDGLVNFLAIFCREKGKEIGGWKAQQRRSYFAAKLTDDWWVWGIDIALVKDMDQPQADYFEAIAGAMREKSNIILCSAEPGWYSAESSSNSYKTLSYAALLAKKAKRDLRIPIILSGDSHHYAHYVGDGSHYITSGGGGAFLHGTLELKDTIEAKWLQSPKEVLNLQSCYPSKDESRKLLDASAAFGKSNPGLTWVLSAVYLLGAFLITVTQRWEVVLLVGAVLFGGIWGYYGYQEGAWRKTVLPAAYHGGAHFLVILAYSIAALWLNGILWPESSWHWLFWLTFLAVPLGFVGPTISGRIFGWSLRLGCLRYDISHNDAFSAMRLNSHRHFLRIKISGNSATIYPVKIESIPGRSGWIENPERAPKNGKSIFKPKYELTLGLIEPPIEVHAFAASSTEEIKKPDELASATASSQGKTV